MAGENEEEYIPEEAKRKTRKEVDSMIEGMKTDMDEKKIFKSIDKNANINPDIKDEMKIVKAREIIKEQSAGHFARFQVENEDQRKMYNDLLKEREVSENELKQTKIWEIKKKNELKVKLKGIEARIRIIGDNLKATESLIKNSENRIEVLSGRDENENNKEME